MARRTPAARASDGDKVGGAKVERGLVRRAAVDDVGGDELDQHARLADRAIRVYDFRGRPALVERDDAAERTLERRRAAELGDDPARAVGAQRRELGRVVAERRVVALV